MIIGHLDDLGQQRLGNVGQMIANPHQGQRTADIGSGNAQYVDFFENAQLFYLVF
jgi:hypothetical protein